MKKLLPIIMLLALFCIPRESKAYCFTYSKTLGASAPGWNRWGNWVQPGSFISVHPNGLIYLDRLESAGRFGILERVFKLAEVNDVVVTPLVLGCPTTHLPPDPYLNPLSACQATAWVSAADGDRGIKFSIQMIDPDTYQYLAVRDFTYVYGPVSGLRIYSGISSACGPNVLLRVVLTSTGLSSSDIIIRDARVDFYTNPNH